MDCYFPWCGKPVEAGFGRTTRSPAISTNSAEENPSARIPATTGVAQNQPWKSSWPRRSAMDAPATPPNAPKIRVNRESSNGAWHAGQVISYDCVSAAVHGIRTKHKGHFRFHMEVPTSAIPLSLQIGKHDLRGSPSAAHRPVHLAVLPIITTTITPRPN